MTQPLTPDQQPPTAVPVGVAAVLVPGPDGQPWVQLQLNIGLSVHAIIVPEATAEELAVLVPQKLTEMAAQARRAKLGLFLPDGAQLPQMPPVNGHRPNGHAPGPR